MMKEKDKKKRNANIEQKLRQLFRNSIQE